MTTRLSLRQTFSAAAELFGRPQPVSVTMVLLFAIVPIYLFIGGALIPGTTLHAPELALDRALPLLPAWSLIYGSLFLAALLPVFVVHQQELIRRTLRAYLTIWLVSYAIFLTYPTIAPEHAEVTGDGFLNWALGSIYASDVPYNCFPSLHVAQCFLAALTCHRVHRGVGVVALVWAAFVGLSTLFTKQHYIVDVFAGAALAYAAYCIYLRSYPRAAIPNIERQLAPALALTAFSLYGLMLVLFWLIYTLDGA